MKPTIVYLTAGGAGMYCGSCMHDNTLARALSRRGVDVLLTPMYTPIRTDEENVSIERVFFGGVNVYLQQKIPLFRRLPDVVDRVFDQPWLLRLATRLGIETSAHQLGAMTVSMLRGVQGNQGKEVRKLCRWLAEEVRPQLLLTSNLLIAGSAPTLRETLQVPLLVTLQGDDIFLDDLVEPYKSQAFDEIHRLTPYVDGFLAHSGYYADHMASYLDIPREKIHLVPLGIDTRDFEDSQAAAAREPFPPGRRREARRPPTLGYLARLAPEKGLHVLVDAFLELRRRPLGSDARLHVAGWLGEPHRKYAEAQFARLRRAGVGESFQYAGIVDRRQKVAFLQDLDVFSVPTVYRDPKGLFVLESLAAGVPVVAPAHGAFPELVAQTGGGLLAPPNDPRALADRFEELLADEESRRRLASDGRARVLAKFNADAMAQATWERLAPFLPTREAETVVRG